MADKYLYQNAGTLTEREGLVTSSGASDAGKIPALDSTGRIDDSLMPVGTASETAIVAASEALSAGDFVNIYASTGAKCRKADATTSGKEADGFVLAAVTSGDNATVYRLSQTNSQLTSLTPGTRYFLATTAGGVTATAPSSSGNVIQELGVAVSSTELVFAPKPPIVLA